MMNTEKAKMIAEETMNAISNEKYKTKSGKTVHLDSLVKSSVSNSKLYKPGCIINCNADKNESPKISVTLESTLEAALRLSDDNACVLNFASAKNPGGGFLAGTIAQEETIARSSGLYQSLIKHPEYYEENKKSQADNIGLYTDYAIYSPNVPVFRNDRGEWLDEPYLTSIITSPAPNRRAIADEQEVTKETETIINFVFAQRLQQVLKIMQENGHRTIILGAWGCGIFGNDPEFVSQMFKNTLKNLPYFDEIVFAIYDKPESQTVISFKKEFENDSY